MEIVRLALAFSISSVFYGNKTVAIIPDGSLGEPLCDYSFSL